VPEELPSAGAATAGPRAEKPGRGKTAHLKAVPESKEIRRQIRRHCRDAADRLDKSQVLTRPEMEAIGRALLDELKLPEAYLGFTMVALASAFWRDQVAAVEPSRRLLVLPHCLKDADDCPGEFNETELDCRTCRACGIGDFRRAAEEMGYKILVAEGSPVVLKILVNGEADAIVGVACLNVLEKTIDNVLLAGIPCMAVPLLSNNCRDSQVDEDWVYETIRTHHGGSVKPARTYLHLLRAAYRLFEPDELVRLAPRRRDGPSLAEINGDGAGALDPIAATETIAYDFLTRGGKYSRPFITLAVYDALTGGAAAGWEGAAHVAGFPDAVRRTAMSIETFHKASLVHDDIEDDDDFRYGRPTLHREYGVPTAVNVGDYLIGMGYRLVSHDAATLGADAVADILDRLAEAHLRLSEGQGAELMWRDASVKNLTPIDALKIYALKTAPAFEAALYCGARLAGPADEYADLIKRFARNLGVAFQIVNDLNDWRTDDDNKILGGGDVLGGRPTVLWAMALAGLSGADRDELQSLLRDRRQSAETKLARIGQLYDQADVFDRAAQLVEKYRRRAEQLADQARGEALRRLLHYLVETVLQSPIDCLLRGSVNQDV